MRLLKIKISLIHNLEWKQKAKCHLYTNYQQR